MYEIEEHDLLSHVCTLGDRLSSAIHIALGQHSHVGNIRWRGLFWTVEVVSDRETKTPFPVSRNMTGRLQLAAFAKGVVTYPYCLLFRVCTRSSER
jgi:adenosylmethionine-8-amino-7-oxononanoate aminotransferase